MVKGEEGYNISDTGNWNVAADYSRLKIMKNLYLADEYSNLAIFGSASIVEELQNEVPIDILRLKGLERLVNCLIMLIDNTLFAVKKGGKEDLVKYRKILRNIIKILPTLSKTKKSQVKRTREVQIIPEKFNKILDFVLDIKTKINEPLNKSHLIFTDKEEFDPRKYKEQVIKDVTTRG